MTLARSGRAVVESTGFPWAVWGREESADYESEDEDFDELEESDFLELESDDFEVLEESDEDDELEDSPDDELEAPELPWSFL